MEKEKTVKDERKIEKKKKQMVYAQPSTSPCK